MKLSIERCLGGTLLACMATLFSATASAQAARPALTRDIDRPEAQPVNGFCSGYLSFGSIKCTLYTVPANKRLVVEMISYYAFAESGKQVFQILVGNGDAYLPYTNALFSANIFSLNPTPVLSSSTGNAYSDTRAVRIYLDAGSVLIGGVSSTGTVAYEQKLGFSGYLVDK